MGNMTGRTIFAVTLFLMATNFGLAECRSIERLQDDEAHPEVAADKTEYAMTVISNQDYLSKEPGCVRAAIVYLGMQHVEKAIPQLVDPLSYRQTPGFGHLPRGRGEEYPAIVGLKWMGSAAFPALTKILATKDNTTVESKNALDAYMNIYQGHAEKALKTLEQASYKETDSVASSRLRQAAIDGRSLWCQHSECTE